MDWWVWISVAAGVLVFIALVMVFGVPAARRGLRREKAAQLRSEAEEKLMAASRREAAARQEKAAAERDRLAAEEALKQADAVDPDLPELPAETDGATMLDPEPGEAKATARHSPGGEHEGSST